MTIRPPWAKLFNKRNTQTDFTVSPVHDIEDDVEDTGSGGGSVTLEPLVTGVTDEYPDSELIYDEDGDIVTGEI